MNCATTTIQQNDFPRFQRAHRRGSSLAEEDLDKISRSRSRCTCTQTSLSNVYSNDGWLRGAECVSL